MEEKVIKMIIYYVLACYESDKKTIETCIELNKLLIAMVKNEETKADKLINCFPDNHPVPKIYAELRDNDNLLELLQYSKEKFEKANVKNECLNTIEDDVEVEELSMKLVKGV